MITHFVLTFLAVAAATFFLVPIFILGTLDFNSRRSMQHCRRQTVDLVDSL